MSMTVKDHELVPEAIVDKDGLKVSKSPWGPDDEIGRLNWITPETNRAILEHLSGGARLRPQRRVLHRHAVLGRGRRPAVRDLDDAHARRARSTTTSRASAQHVHERYSYCGDSIHLYTHCGTHVDTLNHLGHHGMFWNGWTADKDLGSRIWNKGGLDKYPPIIARGVLLDVAGMHGVDELEAGYGITPQDLQDTVAKQGVELRKEDVVLVRTGRMRAWPDFDGYLQKPPGITLPSAKWLCEEAGAMCIAGDSIGLEVMPWDEPDAFLPVHAYMFATAGAQIIEVVEHGGDRGREAVRVRVPRLPDEAPRRDRGTDALVRRAAPRLAATRFQRGRVTPRPRSTVPRP